MQDPVLVAQLGREQLAQGRVAEREPAALGHAVGLVLELVGEEIVEVLRGEARCRGDESQRDIGAMSHSEVQ